MSGAQKKIASTVPLHMAWLVLSDPANPCVELWCSRATSKGAHFGHSDKVFTGWVGWTDGQTDGQADGRTQTDAQMDGRTNFYIIFVYVDLFNVKVVK